MQKDEVFSSHNREKQNLDFMCTFVGFKRHLVMDFLKQMLSFYEVSRVILVTSKKASINVGHEEPPNEKLLKEAVEYIDGYKAQGGANVEIQILRMKFMWDFFAYANELSKLKGENALINLSAGPAAYSSAAMVWAITNDYMIAYSIESKKYGSLETNAVFKQFSITPCMNYNFKTDQIDKEIINAVLLGCRKSSEIREKLIESGFDYSLRTIETRVLELSRKKIVHIGGGKIYKITIAEVIEKILSKNN